jgi:predicted RNase H-like HicB family nuclease
MPEPHKSSPTSLRLLRLMRTAAANDSGDGLAPISHRVPINVPDSTVPLTFTIHLAPYAKGTFIATCAELPELTTFGADEREALEAAEDAIQEILAFPPDTPEIPS